MSAAFSAKLEELKKELVADAVEDHVDLSWYVHDVRESFGLGEASDDTELMFHTAAFLYSLLEEGLIRAGDLTGDRGLVPWDEDAAGVVERIITAWRELGRAPHLWEIVWFDATAKGEAYAKDVLSSDCSE